MTFIYLKRNKELCIHFSYGEYKGDCSICNHCKAMNNYEYINDDICFWLSWKNNKKEIRLTYNHDTNKAIFTILNSPNVKNMALLNIKDNYLPTYFYENILKGDKFYFRIV
jgi:hypothetical protein